MVRHPGFGISRSHPSHQFRSARIAGHNRSPARLSHSKRFVMEYEGNAVLLAHSTVALYAVLVQDGPDASAESYFISTNQRSRAVPQQQSTDNDGSSNEKPDQSSP